MDYAGGPWMADEKLKLRPTYPLINLPWVQMNGRADEGEETVPSPPLPLPLPLTLVPLPLPCPRST